MTNDIYHRETYALVSKRITIYSNAIDHALGIMTNPGEVFTATRTERAHDFIRRRIERIEREINGYYRTYGGTTPRYDD